MIIEHQVVLDLDGKPSAALIPWAEFESIRKRLADKNDEPLSAEWKEELDRRLKSIKNGTAEGIPHDEAMARIKQHLANLQDEQKSA